MQRRHCFLMLFPIKGADSESYAVAQLKQDALWLGHSKLTIRGDNELALVQIIIDRALAAVRFAGVESAVAEGSVPYDPHTNGAAENAVKLVKSQFRIMLLGLERNLKARVPLDHPITTWLISRCGAFRTLQVPGQEGRIAHQRARGNSGPPTLAGFGEVCRYKARSQEGGIGHTS